MLRLDTAKTLELMRRKGLSPYSLARAAGIYPTTAREALYHGRPAQLMTAVKIARALGVDHCALIAGNQNNLTD